MYWKLYLEKVYIDCCIVRGACGHAAYAFEVPNPQDDPFENRFNPGLSESYEEVGVGKHEFPRGACGARARPSADYNWDLTRLVETPQTPKSEKNGKVCQKCIFFGFYL
eukprot:3409901-Amphidinium_carterae.1